MTGAERRDFIIDQIKNSSTPVSGTVLARKCQVSRQVIVQDIALLRASGYQVFSTNRGYVLQEARASRVFKVQHTDEQLEEELCAIVDLGGCVKNVIVRHRVYGQIEADLGISSRRNVQEFLDDIKNGKSSPLKNITSNYHYHMVEADSQKTLDMIEQMLREKGFLLEVKNPE